MSGECCSNCCLTDWEMAGTNVEEGRSKSSQRTCANNSGVIRFSGKKSMNGKRVRDSGRESEMVEKR